MVITELFTLAGILLPIGLALPHSLLDSLADQVTTKILDYKNQVTNYNSLDVQVPIKASI